MENHELFYENSSNWEGFFSAVDEWKIPNYNYTLTSLIWGQEEEEDRLRIGREIPHTLSISLDVEYSLLAYELRFGIMQRIVKSHSTKSNDIRISCSSVHYTLRQQLIHYISLARAYEAHWEWKWGWGWGEEPEL